MIAPSSENPDDLKASEAELYLQGCAIYEGQGMSACIAFALANGIDNSAYCPACESDNPAIDNGHTCFVCGSQTAARTYRFTMTRTVGQEIALEARSLRDATAAAKRGDYRYVGEAWDIESDPSFELMDDEIVAFEAADAPTPDAASEHTRTTSEG
jgi:hypothetical protein